MRNLSLKTIMLTVFLSLIFTVTVFATAPNAEEVWKNTVNFFATWVARIGMVLAFIGAVQWGLGFRNDDADAKSRGLQFFIAGVIVIAVTQSLHLFGLT